MATPTAAQVLMIAQADTLQAYRDLSHYWVRVSLEEDGWHVDYELKSPTHKGGGPHYVIDPLTGATVRAALRALRRGAVGGGCVFRFDGPIPTWAAITYRIAVPLFTILGAVGGCFLFCTRSAYRAVGGFDERLFAAEEVAFAAALK